MQEAKAGKVEVLRFYRPEDISQDEAYRADYWDVYASKEAVWVAVDSIVSKCRVSIGNGTGRVC